MLVENPKPMRQGSCEPCARFKQVGADSFLQESTHLRRQSTYSPRAGLRQDYPLNLNILLSGGKETNKDSPSNGE